MKKYLTLVFLGMTLSATVFAHNIQINQPLPTVKVKDSGELLLNNDKVNYQPWVSSSLVGKVRVVQHFAGRTAAKEKNQGLIAAIKAAHFNPEKYQTTSIINADDAIFGTGAFVKSSAENGKKENAHSQIVLDQLGSVKNAWVLKEKDSIIIVLDKTGKVQFVKEGKLSEAEIKDVIALVNRLIQ